MNPFGWLLRWFRSREREKQREHWRRMREEEQERCPHNNKVINGIDDVRCADCGKDLTE